MENLKQKDYFHLFGNKDSFSTLTRMDEVSKIFK